MALLKLDFRPGIDKQNTPYANEGGWVDSDKIRFRSGRPEKIGGWEKYLDSPLVGVARALHVFRTLDGTIYLAIATNEKVYLESGKGVTDITPIRATFTSTDSDNCLATTSSSTTVVVNLTAHGCDEGDWVTISGASAVGGVPADEINAEHKITYIDGDSFSFEVSTAATSTVAAGGGTAIFVACQINIGQVSGTYQYGWGVGTWGSEAWNTPRSSSTNTIDPRTWTIANWGEDILISHAGGALYLWDATTPTARATIVANAPHKIRTFTVTQDRHVVCFGCNTPGAANAGTDIDNMQVRWSTQEDYTDWTPVVVNTSGDQLLTGGTEIMGAANTEGQVLIWTDDAVHSMQYIGPPYTFGFQQVGTSTGLVSPNAWAAYNNTVYWMGDNGFYVYSGGTAAHECTVQKYVFDEFDAQQQLKTFTSLNRENHEITWFYPATSSEGTDLAAALNTTDTEVIVANTAGYPLTGSIQIGSETIDYSGRTDSKFTGCTRGARGTTPLAHAFGAEVANATNNWSDEPYHYVTYSVLENIWWVGLLERTAWVDKGALKYPIASSTEGYLFEHEKGTDADGAPLVAYVESADFDIGEGDSMMFVHRVIPDLTMTGTVDLTFRSRYYSLSEQVNQTVGTVTPSTTKIDTRIRGRQLALMVKSSNLGDDWRYGSTRIDQRTDGRR